MDSITDIMCLLRLCGSHCFHGNVAPHFPFLLHNKVNSTHGERLSDYLSVSFLGSHQMDCVKECREDEFLCRNHAHCIPKRWRCDDVFDCVDHSDEENCDHGTQKLHFLVLYFALHFFFLFSYSVYPSVILV